MNSFNLRATGLILALAVFFTLLTMGIAWAVGAPFVPMFEDTWAILVAVLLYFGILGLFWDSSLILLAALLRSWRRRKPLTARLKRMLHFSQTTRFFSHGPFPLLLLTVTAWIIYGTGNITLISLTLIGHETEWRDAFFWGIEGPFFEWVAGLPVNTAIWDTLYHSAWGIELFAAFVLVVVSRSLVTVFGYCVSMILLFYLGRFLGALNPVMGPAFYNPELFGYLDGSVSDIAMKHVAEVMALGADAAKAYSGVLLGGVSAMPSLHIGMVTLTAFWLAVERPRTRYITVPWVLLVWVSTVVLGWHYILDGAGGIALGIACAWTAQQLLRTFRVHSPVTKRPETAPA